MGDRSCTPFVICGKVFNPVLPLQLTEEDPPVLLTQASVNTENTNKSRIIINFSGFITSMLREERFGEFVFRLQRFCLDECHSEILVEWPFTRSFVSDTNIKEPIVFNYCDCFSDRNRCCYKFELVSVNLSGKSSYNITQKSMTAQIYSDK